MTFENNADVQEKGPGDTPILDEPTVVDKPNPSNEAPDGGPQAWLVAAGAGCVTFAALGYVNSFGVYQAYYMEHQLHSKTADDIACK